MKLHRDLDITQKSAWYLAMRIREALDTKFKQFLGLVEVDEAYVGGKRKELEGTGHGTIGKIAVVGTKGRETNQVQAKVITDTTAQTLTGFVNSMPIKEAQTYTDDFKGYQALKRATHDTVKYSVSEYVNRNAHINGMESFWVLLKRGYYGTYHRMYLKHLRCYVNEFIRQYNIRELNTVEQMKDTTKELLDKEIIYKKLTRKTKLNSTAI